MEGFAVHPMGTNKEIGLIITKPNSFRYLNNQKVLIHYTLQISVNEIQGNKIMVNFNDVDLNYDWEGYDPGRDAVKSYYNNRKAEDFEKLFAQLDNLLGKAESYRQK
nr:hypothetical protein [uncultured bacterium]